jgi:NAD+ synthase (glutamine-hydrolysing)
MRPYVPFESLYAHGFVRVALCVPEVRVADPSFNTARSLELARRAAEAGAVLECA